MQHHATIRVGEERARLYRRGQHRKPAATKSIGRPKGAPFLKWAGGKQWLAKLAPLLVPPDFDGTFYEPFLGGGAFFFATQPRKACLSDLNAELISTYKAVKSRPSHVVKTLGRHLYDEASYYQIRSRNPRMAHTRAARLIYLNKTCWNGLYRVNQRGDFNVPFGRYDNPTICDAGRIRAASHALRHATLECRDFAEAVRSATEEDLVYFDPPYVTGHHNNGFLKYNSRLFSWYGQKRLGRAAATLKKRGVHVLISNAYHPEVAKLYEGFNCYRLTRQSLIGGQGSQRGVITEALFSSYPLLGVPLEDA